MTSTSIGIAALSGWQRGSALPEQFGCIAVAVGSALGTHLLPALCREKTLAVRCAAALLWAAGMIVLLYGQTSFFVLAQQHAGELRAKTVPESVPAYAPAQLPEHDLVSIAGEQLKIRTALAVIDSRRCTLNCARLQTHRALLMARLDALRTDADETKRREMAEDRQTEQAQRAAQMRDALREDPVTVRLAGWTGIEAERLNLFLALVCACALDGIGSMCWYVALQDRRRDQNEFASDVASIGSAISRALTEDATDGECSGKADHKRDRDARLMQLMRDFENGKVLPTVAGIRKHLGCAQGTAAKLRRELLTLRSHEEAI
jgi:hypothetical protein